ncbi:MULTISPECIES: glycerol-3-phosphate 1-O-acyltransferase PlsY [unclassified Breznakia]|uniref:glycerol-3-phosphate 1-O-acyltransferase PlsY n=1 Tax=unclassified Breznakia TaxID=2623764 RepID=UPI002406815D|nr:MULTISPECIES: glycerol-3-phosphate 1-O-acyltransferase PlsY [unclassified Breznakia]
MYLHIIYAVFIGYFLGSIPFALVIGKLFYNTDVREYGSGNLGGSNAGRVLGKKAAIAVIALDVLKVVLASAIVAWLFDPVVSIWAGLFAAVGHCYPIFAGFRGGKAVATMFGFLLSCSIFTFQDPWMLFIPLAIFLIVLFLFKMVSLASICAAITQTIYILFITEYTSAQVASFLLTLLIIFRHSANIKRILNGDEAKVSWLTKKK